MAKKKVFVSFDWDNDRRYKFLLNAWDENPGFDFSFSDHTPQEIQSNDIGRIKTAISSKINGATYTLVIVGKEANKLHKDSGLIGFRNWINFEVSRSRRYGNRIAIVKLEQQLSIPVELEGARYAWIVDFDLKNVLAVLRKAAE